MNSRVYVATHKPENKLLELADPYIPIHVGKAIHDFSEYYNGCLPYLPELGDDTGNNISNLNSYYSELTAMYWIWKNDNSSEDDIVGLNHYRRYFQSPSKPTGTLMSEEDIKLILIDNKFDFIINGEGTYAVDYTRRIQDAVYYGYGLMHEIKDLDNALTAISDLHPSIAGRIEHELKTSGQASYCNMLITKKKYFDEYAEFLFPVLEYVRIKGCKERVPGYIAERLMRPWIIATGHTAEGGKEVFWDI